MEKAHSQGQTILPDELWGGIEPALPAHLRSSLGGRPRASVSDREALTGILFVLKTDIAWQEAGVWQRLRRHLLGRRTILVLAASVLAAAHPYERHGDIHLTFLNLACAFFAWRFVKRFYSTFEA